MAKLTKENGQPRAWQRMLSGRRLDLLDPSPLDIEVGDIAHGLARVARWNGQTSGDHAFSVAQHSLLVLDLFHLLCPSASKDQQLIALLHDGPEYVVGDLISPFKAVLGVEYKELEARLLAAIHIRFSLPPNPPQKLIHLVKRADGMAAFLEATQLAGFTTGEAKKYFGQPRGFDLSGFNLIPLPAAEAQLQFLDRFHGIQNAQTTMHGTQNER